MSSKKGKNHSFINLMKRERRINENFMNILSSLSLEEDIARFLGIPINKFNEIIKKYKTEQLYDSK